MRIATPILLLLLGLAAASGAPPARAGGPPYGPGHGPPPLDALLERNAERLGLDAEALARIRAAVDASRPEHDRLSDELHTLRIEMRELLDEDAPDRDVVMALADRIGAAETALDKHRLATLLEIRAMLSPEQRRELVRIHDERRERHDAKRRREVEPTP
jgi:Spy/CpxP family protein refolding chaperone